MKRYKLPDGRTLGPIRFWWHKLPAATKGKWRGALDGLVFGLAVCGIVLLTTGCSSLNHMDRSEVTWQALHAIDVAQTMNMVGDSCYKEDDPITKSLIGAEPNEGEVIAWGVATAVGHYLVSRTLERRDAPKWIRRSWDAITITTTAATVYDNHRIGVRPWGSNKPSRSWQAKEC